MFKRLFLIVFGCNIRERMDVDIKAYARIHAKHTYTHRKYREPSERARERERARAHSFHKYFLFSVSLCLPASSDQRKPTKQLNPR